ncbi:hypothetical protein D3C75_598770 [compost metagenome]
MTKFTKEQLFRRAQLMVRKHREMLAINPDYDGVARDVELFEIALAALTAEPVTFQPMGKPAPACYYRLPLLEGLK